MLLLLLLVLAAVFVHQLREVRGQAELAQIKSTLGALRTALVVAHLETAVRGPSNPVLSAVAVSRNPFLVLSALPANYAGLASPEALDALPGGSWVFDPVCACVGYRPLDADRVDSPAGVQALWFRVSQPPGPLQISPQLAYRWMGQTVD